jgi:hypothetical protein
MFSSIKDTIYSFFNSNKYSSINTNNVSNNKDDIYNEYQLLLLELSKINNELHSIEIELKNNLDFNYKKSLQKEYNNYIEKYKNILEDITYLRITFNL